jgi:phosphomannomutase
MSGRIDCFKAYDVRGRVPDQLDEDIAYRIGRAFATWRQARSIAVGQDIRLTSPALCAAAIEGIRDAGSDVVHIGQCGTEEIYFATFHGGHDGGLVVTASHNPKDFNGMKFVREQARPVSGDAGLPEIRALAERGFGAAAGRRGALRHSPDKSAYIDHLLSYIDPRALRPLRVVVNAGNGGAGPVLDLLEPRLPLRFTKLLHEPDGNFPNGVPNPLLEENRQLTAAAVRAERADLGIAWEGDFDRCFFFDERGEFVEGYYVVGLLAEVFLRKHGGGAIVHDPRLIWNTREIVARHGGRAVQSRTGHAFIKQVMRDQDALYGGEMSAHHYFREFAYCDSGMIPWLLVVELLSRCGRPLSELLAERQRAYPVSGEINREVADPAAAIEAVARRYIAAGGEVDRTDGVSISFADWRFNLRMSNTEPLVRLNVETRGDPELLRARTAELLALLDAG